MPFRVVRRLSQEESHLGLPHQTVQLIDCLRLACWLKCRKRFGIFGTASVGYGPYKRLRRAEDGQTTTL